MKNDDWTDGSDPLDGETTPGSGEDSAREARELDARIGAMARAWYNAPPETPREEIWAEVSRALRTLPSPPREEIGPNGPNGRIGRIGRIGRGRVPWLAAAAAVLVVGVGIGRLTAPGPRPGSPAGAISGGSAMVEGGSGTAVDPPDPPSSPAVRVAALEHLGRSESLLTMVRADARAGRYDDAVGDWGQGLLAETRLLLDSPAGRDPAIRPLLEDLELILAQVAILPDDEGMGDARTRSEMDLIARGVEERDVLGRIQAILPAGPTLGDT